MRSKIQGIDGHVVRVAIAVTALLMGSGWTRASEMQAQEKAKEPVKKAAAPAAAPTPAAAVKKADDTCAPAPKPGSVTASAAVGKGAKPLDVCPPAPAPSAAVNTLEDLVAYDLRALEQRPPQPTAAEETPVLWRELAD
jgi:hypothetical protein